jgi:hypothetical protein
MNSFFSKKTARHSFFIFFIFFEMETPLYEQLLQARKTECLKQWNEIMKQIQEGGRYEGPTYTSWNLRKMKWTCFSSKEVEKKLENLTNKKVEVLDGEITLHHKISPLSNIS